MDKENLERIIKVSIAAAISVAAKKVIKYLKNSNK